MSSSFLTAPDRERRPVQRRASSPAAHKLPASDMHGLLLHLQRTAGNQAVNAMLRRQALATAVRRDGSPALLRRAPAVATPDLTDIPSADPAESHGPVKEVSHDVLSYVAEPIRKQAREAYPDHLDSFANLWLTAATTALAGAPEAEDEESTTNWWVALGGNILWAATCLVPQAAVWKAVIAVMSFGGAAVGSGGLADPQEKAPSGKEMIGEMLTAARDAVVNHSAPTMDEAAVECGDKQITDHEEQKKVLWRKLFRTPYDQAEPIRAEMNAKIKAGLGEYLRQWHTWQADSKREAMRKAAEEGEAFQWYEYVKTIKKEKPFTPHLSFDG